MTESWAINIFLIGCIVLMVVPIAVYIYQEAALSRRGDASGI